MMPTACCAFAALFLSSLALAAGGDPAATTQPAFMQYTLNYDTPTDPALQVRLEALDAELRASLGLADAQTAAGLLDLRTLRLALVRPDREEYAASVPKICILLAYFDAHSEAAEHLDPTAREELGRMIKVSSNEIASKYSHELGLKNIQAVLDKYRFYDAARGGGLWCGKHYGKDAERYGSPVGDNSHAATVRQLVRFYLLLEQGKLVSPKASKVMREVFESPQIPHDGERFLKGLAGRPDLSIIRKAGWWEDWHADTAVVTGAGRHYVLVALTHTPKGDAYLEELARQVDRWFE